MLQTSQLDRNVETTCVMINCESGSEGRIIDKIREIQGVKECVRTTGPYDILAIIESNTVELLKEIIENKIRKIQSVNATTTLVIATKF
ncbi:Lrp/AsnC ligand binding domain-containing protein [Candidatus Nitrosotalea okcheonensis]|uniref:AsnC family transcriptional regulator n=1 Tax=Candidatus Nitrosotalea okcheonensis TaxID=1903276 RepID=A0A2H1FCT9_9ARCH|nr:Lrp/AsnC ligand binding domain-containing protein [Candidatus Nitrosotalea okcheonensis]MDE1728107.1 Lrp/AsnC ligand binding domain-containing protein [Nitrososphaerota archaeon]MDE1830866.1 Lrp/AsnC ligand binding domain-containing protein [Nitrososphaerota archaeon]MDE1841198.1 Lrp/AsnC ligand binding domain-containing protein [Nitrososphaerota archaeon]MDE1877112.1 Lrp/AsnC ligand binding domain-containing protein [Nitrososphaerota archaeon]SMH70575.1 AsnC family transcriptional regulato